MSFGCILYMKLKGLITEENRIIKRQKLVLEIPLLHSRNPATNRWTRSLNTHSENFHKLGGGCFSFFDVASWPNLGLRRRRVGL